MPEYSHRARFQPRVESCEDRSVPAAWTPIEDGTVVEAKTRGRSMATGRPVGPVFGPRVDWDGGGTCNVYAGQVAVLPEDA